MRTKRFQTKNDYKRLPLEKPKGLSKVETAGYVPAKKKIYELIQAGRQLDQVRKEQFDTVDINVNDDDLEIDKTIDSNYDLADASQDLLELERKAIDKNKEKLEKEKKKKKKEVKKNDDKESDIDNDSNDIVDNVDNNVDNID